MPHIDFAVGIGGAAGQGVATPGNILAKLFARRGLHINGVHAYQSIIAAAILSHHPHHEEPVRCMGTTSPCYPAHQDTMDPARGAHARRRIRVCTTGTA